VPATARDFLLDLGLSRPATHRVLSEGRLVAGGVSLGPASRLVQDEEVELVPAYPSASPRGPAAPQPAAVLYDDPFVVAVAKPAGLLVHGDGTGAPTLTDGVAAWRREQDGVAFVQALHRLDVETTGAVLFSKTVEFQPAFDALVAGSGLHKRYLVVADGVLERRRCSCREPLARDRHDASRMRASRPGTGQDAWTDFELLDVAPDASCCLLAAELHTGRRHQIRVHLSHLGHPVVNDPLYGRVVTPDGLMLHAFELRFEHPVTHEPVCVRTPWPKRFTRWFFEREV
jgi:23S rRNA pseudouridine1911/1915/1917 synthase